MVQRLLPLIPEHRSYVEPFCGSARLLFAKPPSEVEVVNDVHGALMNFYRVLRFRPSELACLLEKVCHHSGEFTRMLKAAQAECELERAAATWFTGAFSFGCKGQNFAWPSPTQGAKRNRAIMRSVFHAASKRMSRVGIDCRDFSEVFSRYDAPDTFFFCDPPYESFKQNGRYCAKEGLFESLVQHAKQAKGKVLISYSHSETAVAQATAAGLCIRNIKTVYTLSGYGKQKSVGEILLANYELPEKV